MPYLYSMAAAVTFDGTAMVRALGLEFPEDIQTHGVVDEYMFGRSLLVCPVVQPMYFGPRSKPLEEETKARSVYLPLSANWFDFWSGTIYRGGETVVADCPIEKIPLFVREGSILAMTEVMQYVDEVHDAQYEIRVYPGKDAQFVLYEDAGDGYGYACGERSLIRMHWNEREATFLIEKREGSFPGMIEARDYRIVLVRPEGSCVRVLCYTGEEALVRLGEGEG